MSSIEDKIKGDWKQIKGRLKKTWGSLTDDDLTYNEGSEEELIGKIQKKTGETKEKIKEIIDSI